MVLALGVGAYALLQSLVVPVLPTIEHALGTTQTNVTWVLTAYLLSASVFTPILGRLGDMAGKKKMFVVALIALALGSLLAALAHSLLVMIIARVIQGIGGGAMPLAFGIIRDEFPAAKVAGAVGAIAALVAVGGGIGVVLAGPIVSTLDYHWLFWLPLIMISISAVAAIAFVPESPVLQRGSINYGTAALLSAWLVALLLGVSQGEQWGWFSGRIIGLFIAAIVLAVVWVTLELRSANPLIDMTMMRRRAVWSANLVALLVGIGMYAVFGFLPAFVQTPSIAGYGFGASVTQSGLLLLPQTITMFVFGLITGKLSARFGSQRVLVVASAISALAMFLLTFAHSTKLDILVSMAIIGIGFGWAFAAMANVIVEAVPREQTGVASGMNANIRTIGGSIGAAVMGSVVTGGVAEGSLPREAGYTHGFLMLAIVLCLAAVAALFIPRTTASEEPDQEVHHGEMAMVAAGTVLGDKSE